MNLNEICNRFVSNGRTYFASNFFLTFLWKFFVILPVTWVSCLLQKRRVFLADPNKLSGSSCFVRALSDTQLKRLLSKIALIWVVLTYVREFKRDMQPFCFQWPYIFCFQLFSNLFLWKFFVILPVTVRLDILIWNIPSIDA